MLFCASVRAVEVYFDRDCKPQVLEAIRGQKSGMSASIYDINEPDIVDAILEAHFSGKDVRLMSDRRQAQGEHSRALDLYLMGVDIRLNSKGRLHHKKTAIIDDRIALTGSFNWTRSAARSNSEDLTVLKRGFLNWSENRTIQDMQSQFDEDWAKNTPEKSEKYFEAILKDRMAEARERLAPWARKTLKGGAAGRNKLLAAIRLVDKLQVRDKATLDLVARRAEPGLKSEIPVRVAAIQALGRSATPDRDHQMILLMAAADSRPEVRAAAKAALQEIGELHPEARPYQGLGAALWRTKIFCRSLWHRFF